MAEDTDDSVIDTLNHMSEHASKHGHAMYRIALEHAINMVEIDAEQGLAGLKTELAELKKEKDNE